MIAYAIVGHFLLGLIVYNINMLYITSSTQEVYYAKILSLSHHAESHD